VEPPPSVSNSKTSGQGRAARNSSISLSEVKGWAWDATRNAMFSPKSDSLISEWLRSHSNADRASLRKTVRSIVEGLDEFGLKTAGNTIASNLDRAEHDAKADANYAAEQVRQTQIIDSLIEAERRKSDEEYRQIEERNARPHPSADDLFGAQEPAPPTPESQARPNVSKTW
jgi:hypothetical protein